MQTVTDSFILIGLDNGILAGWNLQKNVIEIMQVHVQPITCLQRYPNLIFIGTTKG